MDNTKVLNVQEYTKTALILVDTVLKILAGRHAWSNLVLMIRALANSFANTEQTTHSLKLKINTTTLKKTVSIPANTQSMKIKAVQIPMLTVMLLADTTLKIHAIKLARRKKLMTKLITVRRSVKTKWLSCNSTDQKIKKFIGTTAKTNAWVFKEGVIANAEPR